MELMEKNPCLMSLLVFSQKEVHDKVSKMAVFKIILLFNLFVAVIIFGVTN